MKKLIKVEEKGSLRENDFTDLLKDYNPISQDTLVEIVILRQGKQAVVTYERQAFVVTEFDRTGEELSSSIPFTSIMEVVAYINKL